MKSAWPTIAIYLFPLLVIFCILTSACTRSGSSPTAEPDIQSVPQTDASPKASPGFDLPLPSELPVGSDVKSASYTEASIFENGYSYEVDLPKQNYTELGFSGEFAADWTGGLNGAAYAGFKFTVDGYDRAPQLRYYWNVPPDPIASAYIGLANFAEDRWDWWQCSNGNWFPFADIAPYTRSADDAMIAMVVVAGSGTSELRYLRLGNTPVTAEMKSDTYVGLAPLTVYLNGTNSTSDYGAITSYEWDFDGNGTIDESGPDPNTSHVYTSPGTYYPRMTVVTAQDERATDDIKIDCMANWSHSWGGSLSDRIEGTAFNDEAIYAAGWTRSFSKNPNESVLLLSYDYSGNLNWAKGWGGSVTDWVNAADINGNEPLITVGGTESFGAGNKDVLIQAWDKAGDLLWSTTWGGSGHDIAYGVEVYGDTIYVCGVTSSFKDGSGDALLLACDIDGNVQWSRAVGIAGGLDEFRDLDARYAVIAGKLYIYLTGRTDTLGPGTGVLYARFDANGDLLNTHSWHEADATWGEQIFTSGLSSSPTIFIAGGRTDATNTSGLLLEFDTSPFAMSWTGTGETYAKGLWRHQGSSQVAGFIVNGGGDTDAYLARFSDEGAVEDFQLFTTGGSAEQFLCMSRFPGTGWLLGGMGLVGDGQWTPSTVTPKLLNAEWVDYGTIYVYTPEDPVTGSPDVEPELLEDGIIDDSTGANLSDALLVTAPW